MSGAFLLLMVCAAGVGSAAATVAEVAARTVDELRWSWVAAGLALYGAIVLPIDVLAATTVPHLLVVGLVAQVGAVALLAVALRPPRGGQCRSVGVGRGRGSRGGVEPRGAGRGATRRRDARGTRDGGGMAGRRRGPRR